MVKRLVPALVLALAARVAVGKEPSCGGVYITCKPCSEGTSEANVSGEWRWAAPFPAGGEGQFPTVARVLDAQGGILQPGVPWARSGRTHAPAPPAVPARRC
jgi:hypothetical protein